MMMPPKFGSLKEKPLSNTLFLFPKEKTTSKIYPGSGLRLNNLT
jgi:hypothetical protein